MPQQPMTRNEQFKKMAQMRIDNLKKMGVGRQGRVPRPAASPRAAKPERTA